MQTSSPTPGNPTGSTLFSVHRLETVRVRIDRVIANSPEEAVIATNGIDMRKVIDRTGFASSALSCVVSVEDLMPLGFMVDPMDKDGEIMFNFETHLKEDRSGNLYRLPPTLSTECDEALILIDRLSELNSEVEKLSSVEIQKVLLSLIEEAREVRERHNAFPLPK